MVCREVGCGSVAAMDAQLSELERLAPGFPKVQYVRYLAHMHAGDVPAATDALHRYFDYGTGQDGSALTAEGGAKGQTGRFQNALLNLGSMHVHFGHAAEATQVRDGGGGGVTSLLRWRDSQHELPL